MFEKKLEDAVWTAHSLFERGKTSGSSANMSFRHGDQIYISASGTCFGTLTEKDFAVISLAGDPLSERKPSKEWPLHLALYEKSPEVEAVIHTHSTYSVLWSFVPQIPELDCIPDHTPYLKMKLGTVGLIPYEKPGSEALFSAFRQRVKASDGFLLKNHAGCLLLSGGAGGKRPDRLGALPCGPRPHLKHRNRFSPWSLKETDIL